MGPTKKKLHRAKSQDYPSKRLNRNLKRFAEFTQPRIIAGNVNLNHDYTDFARLLGFRRHPWALCHSCGCAERSSRTFLSDGSRGCRSQEKGLNQEGDDQTHRSDHHRTRHQSRCRRASSADKGRGIQHCERCLRSESRSGSRFASAGGCRHGPGKPGDAAARANCRANVSQRNRWHIPEFVFELEQSQRLALSTRSARQNRAEQQHHLLAFDCKTKVCAVTRQ